MLALFRQRRTNKQLGEVLGTTGVSVGRKISGQSTFTFDELLATARWLEVPLSELLPGDDYDPQPALAEGRRGRGVRHVGLEPTTRWLAVHTSPYGHASHTHRHFPVCGRNLSPRRLHVRGGYPRARLGAFTGPAGPRSPCSPAGRRTHLRDRVSEP
jgi:hypothetical protein